jgi:peptidoglycan/LPS O-acetylase OafA/YrhL
VPVKLDLTSKNIPVINCLRGIAASMVCFFHFVAKGPYVHNTRLKDIFDYGRTGVYIFFVISGIIISLSMIRGGYRYRNWGSFMLKRLVRIEPPYLACIILALLYFQVRTLLPTSANVNLTPSTRDIMLHVGYLVPFFHGQWILASFWTLAVEFQYYLVLSLLLPLVLTGIKACRYCFYLIFLCFPFLLPDIKLFPLHAPFFLIGILYTLWQMNIIESKECFILTLLCITVSVIVAPISRSIAALATIMIINFLPALTTSALDFLGKISYSLYLLHPITGKAFINVLVHKFNAGYQVVIVVIAGYIVSVISAYVLYKIVEKPAQRLSGKIKYYRTFITFKKQDI